MKPYYAAISPDGRILGLERDADGAVELVKDALGKRAPIAVQVLPEVENPESSHPSADEMAIMSEINCQIGKISRDEVMAMKLKDAHEVLKPFFDGLISKGTEPTTKYNTPSGMADAWIGQNYKTEKPSQDPGRPAEVMGLTLIPASHARLASLGRGPYSRLFNPGEKEKGPDVLAQLEVTKRKMIARWEGELPARITPKFTWCQGSSQECRDSCLVFAGQNAAARYNTYRKLAQAMALLNQPTAFMRMLVASIDQWISGCDFFQRKNKGVELAPFFRMNVLSDIPWERITSNENGNGSWFFDHFARKSGENGKQIRFYDYTKVPGRRGMPGFPKNYDLTFSISGTETNEQYAIEEVERYDSRIAVVFLAHRKSDGEWETYTGKGKKGEVVIKEIPLPERFQLGSIPSLRIVDGDLSDVRPHNPGRTCVGLRWKTPSGKRSGVEDHDFENMSFVTPIYIKSQSKPAGYEANPNDRDAVLISAVTPRYQPIDQPMSQAL